MLLCGPLLGPAGNDEVASSGERWPGKTPSLSGSPRRLIQSTQSTEADSAAHLRPQTQHRIHQRLEFADGDAEKDAGRQPRSCTAPPSLRSDAGTRAATMAETEDKIRSGIAAAATTNPRGNMALKSESNRRGGRRDWMRSGANLFSAVTLVAGDELGAGQKLATKTTPSLQLYKSERRIRHLPSHR
jgi:hypothetical protein